MDNLNNVQLPKKKYYVIGIILLITISLVILTSLSYKRNYSLENIFLDFFRNISLSTSTTSIAFTYSIISNLTSSKTTTTTTDINEVLCDNIFKNHHLLNNSNNPCERLRCAIVIHRSGGRLGNRMFIFASAYGLARTHGCRLYAAVHIINELRDIFKMSIKENLWLPRDLVNGLNGVVVKDTVCSFLPDMLRPNAFKNIELQGYWQSYLYFDGYRDEIREIFSGRSEVLTRLAQYFSNITKIDCPTCSIPSSISHNELRQIIQMNYNITWIGIHIRRQDFTGLGYASNEYYIHRAMAYYKRRFYKQNIRFLVASDDKPYCYRLFATEIQFRQVFILPVYFPRGDDLIALSFCHHSIVTGGSYGFWTAYLAGGEVIHDKVYRTGCASSDYYPSWFKLVGQPKQLGKVR